jgi:hypothetical protein
VEKLWRLHEYTEECKVQLASSEFEDLALIWWDHVCNAHVIDRVPAIVTWRAMKEEIRHRFVPANYVPSLYDKLTNLKQGLKTVDEYFYEMEMIMQHAKVREPEDQTMQCVLAGLSFQIRRIVRHHPYEDMCELLHQCREAEATVAKEARFAVCSPSVDDAFHHVLPLLVRILVVFVRLVLLVTVRILL